MGSQTAYYSFSSSEWSFVSPSSALSSSWGGSKFVSKFSAACVSSNGSTGGASSWTNVVLLLVLRNETLELLVFSLEHGVILSLNQCLWLSTKINIRMFWTDHAYVYTYSSAPSEVFSSSFLYFLQPNLYKHGFSTSQQASSVRHHHIKMDKAKMIAKRIPHNWTCSVLKKIHYH